LHWYRLPSVLGLRLRPGIEENRDGFYHSWDNMEAGFYGASGFRAAGEGQASPGKTMFYLVTSEAMHWVIIT